MGRMAIFGKPGKAEKKVLEISLEEYFSGVEIPEFVTIEDIRTSAVHELTVAKVKECVEDVKTMLQQGFDCVMVHRGNEDGNLVVDALADKGYKIALGKKNYGIALNSRVSEAELWTRVRRADDGSDDLKYHTFKFGN